MQSATWSAATWALVTMRRHGRWCGPRTDPLLPLQDVLGQGSEARMNPPGVAGGNWSYRFGFGQLAGWAAPVLRDLALVFGRL